MQFKKMGFKAFVKYAAVGKVYGWNGMGDFVDDAALDRTFKNFKTWPSLKTYLETCSACDNAIVAAKKVFKNWQGYHGEI